jgi:hypothetical protein
MPKWMVRLRGQSADLQEFPDLFRSARLNVREEGGGYYLRSSDFDALSTSQEVREKASELLPLLTGIVKLQSGYSEAVTQDAVIEVKDDGTCVEIKESAARMRARAKITIGKLTSDSAPTEGELWLNLSQQDAKVMDALRFFEEETTWWSLRKTYEAVEFGYKRQESLLNKKLGLRSLGKIKQFKEWASYHVHGEQGAPPNQDQHPLLTLPQAESFIRDLLITWLRQKQNNY